MGHVLRTKKISPMKMKNNKEIREFVKFLKDNNIYLQFKYYSSNSKYWSESMPYECKRSSPFYMNYNSTPHYFIYYAFAWRNTDEGFDFWEQKHRAWCNICDKKINNHQW